ncbi:LysR family transcriptional regulator [Thioflexithrix psekupsensis]|uniref:LysR family transcriptional regulator n=1 Tax=Thioflexithrix psekupsensis TaxID=1570016 RepID=A0A251XB75_9GAMM|nr:LysR family transcriptional regulator [Thioflexithrix psekupsensis]OUD15548.1 LysR family transcriptional regulator [Thioflexithrix psekupsensis]
MADRRLQVFHTVARLLSFTKAAEALHMTQPAVTFQVRQLEEHFNTRLFDRTHNRITLTEIGQLVYDYAERIFDLYSQMDNAVKEMTGDVSGILLIGASTTIAEYMLPALLGDFKNRYPEVIIRLRVANTDEIVSMVENNLIDLGVVEAPVHNKSLAVELCRMDQLVGIVPVRHPLAAKESVTVDELARYPFIFREEGSGTREVITEYFAAAQLSLFDLNIIMELGSSEAIKGAVTSGMGVSILSRATIQKELQLGTLKSVELEPKLERPFSFVHQKQKFRLRTMEELLNFARHYCQTHPE